MSFLIYFTEFQKKSVLYFSLIMAFGLITSILIYNFFTPDTNYLENKMIIGVRVIFFCFLFFYKIISLVYNYQTIIKTNLKNESKLKVSETRYRNQFENNLLGMIVFNSKMEIIDVNKGFCKMIGYSKDELIEERLLINNLKHNHSLLNNFEKLVARKITNFTSSYTFKRKNDYPLHTTIFASSTYDKNGNFINSTFTILDITEKIEVESQMILKSQVIKGLVENFPTFYYCFDENLTITKSVGSGLKVLGLEKNELVGVNISHFYNDYPEIIENHKKSFSGKIESFESAIKTKNGDMAFFDLKLFYDTVAKRGIVIGFNITEKKKQEQLIQQSVEQLNKKNKDLEKYIESNNQLENFAYMASHDLKAPLRSILGYSQLLVKKTKQKLDKTEIELFNFIISSSKNMNQLIENLLTYSKVNSQKTEFENINGNNLLEIIINELNADIKEKKVNISFSNIPSLIIADRTRIKQLFQNLISNAIKFIEKDKNPRILIDCKETETHFQFSVKDNGIGIKSEYQEKIFSLFVKLHGSSEFEGTGIGLALCKKIVEQHGGNIWVDSIYGLGTTFFFTIEKRNLESETFISKKYQQTIIGN